MHIPDSDLFCPASQTEWRQWLTENHQVKPSVWLIYYKKQSGITTITWSQAVDEALCFGWIDSKRISLDQDKFMQFFTRRKPKGTWSKVNKEKIRQLIADGLMTPAGLASIEKAKQNGSWTILDEVEELMIPVDLETELKVKPGALNFFCSLSKSIRKSSLQWLALAKKPETRQSRIIKIADLASKKIKPAGNR